MLQTGLKYEFYLLLYLPNIIIKNYQNIIQLIAYDTFACALGAYNLGIIYVYMRNAYIDLRLIYKVVYICTILMRFDRPRRRSSWLPDRESLSSCKETIIAGDQANSSKSPRPEVHK